MPTDKSFPIYKKRQASGGVGYGPFRSEKCLGTIIEKAGAMHTASDDFFQDPKNVRIDTPAKEIVPKLFVREGLVRRPKNALTVNECFERHLGFCDDRGSRHFSVRSSKL